jgi:homogentisate 1,2-dioxygenase
VASGDYLVIPRATTHRWMPDGGEPLRAYCIEASSHIAAPKRSLSIYGQLLEHAPYSERDLRLPQGPLLAEDTGTRAEEPTEFYLKHRGNGPGGIVGTIYTYPQHPLDVVGWDGCLYPYAFNVSDFEPITGRRRSTRSSRATNFVICNFVPRKVDNHPLSIPVPYLPLERGQRRDHVLRRRRLRGTQRVRNRQGLGLGAPGRSLAWPAAGGV